MAISIQGSEAGCVQGVVWPLIFYPWCFYGFQIHMQMESFVLASEVLLDVRGADWAISIRKIGLCVYRTKSTSFSSTCPQFSPCTGSFSPAAPQSSPHSPDGNVPAGWTAASDLLLPRGVQATEGGPLTDPWLLLGALPGSEALL